MVRPQNELGRFMAWTLPEPLRKGLPWVAGTLGFVVLCYGAIQLVQDAVPTPEADTFSVARAWNDTISRLGIEPIFPPEEDVHVGDVYAVVTRGDVAFLGRAIKLTHVDMSEALNAAYAKLPMFPDTAARPDHDEDPWPQRPSDAELFAPAPRRTLSLVAFPGFSVRRARGADAGLSSGGGLLRGMFGVGRSSDEIEEIRIPTAETYGVGALLAAGHLAAFCEGPLAAACTETGARNVLSMQVGDEVWKREVDKVTGQETGRYAMGVELALVNRVYLTRSMVHLRGTETAQGTRASIAAQLKDALDQQPSPTPAPSAGSQAGEPAVVPLAAVDAQRKRLKALMEELSTTTPGGVVSIAAADSRQVALKQTFVRPVAIGFRAVRWVPQPTAAAQPSGSALSSRE